jgi:hypothetical protein
MKNEPFDLCPLCQKVEEAYAVECMKREDEAREKKEKYECTCPNVRCFHETK